MCCLIVEVIMLLTGIYGLFSGKLILADQLSLTGGRARIASIFLIVPLPLALFFGFVLGILAGQGFMSQSTLATVSLIVEPLLVLGGLAGVVVVDRVVR
jgi:hypothetical protein